LSSPLASRNTHKRQPVPIPASSHPNPKRTQTNPFSDADPQDRRVCHRKVENLATRSRAQFFRRKYPGILGRQTRIVNWESVRASSLVSCSPPGIRTLPYPEYRLSLTNEVPRRASILLDRQFGGCRRKL
jgi:hypothetical protein